jgi:EAL domain-containing protein (putative c-di-GMP-specific phosphodiesterase class I)
LTRLKIDQSFVRDIDTTPVNESIARAIIALANSLSLDIVAEGIETEAELSVLRCLNCHQGQGLPVLQAACRRVSHRLVACPQSARTRALFVVRARDPQGPL